MHSNKSAKLVLIKENNMNKILTVIIPTYNMEKYITKCLDSLLVSEDNMNQLEVLVVNDGSKDASSEIAHKYEDRFPQTFRVIDKQNGNYGSCINRGLKEAQGKYVKVLDADDYYNTESFNRYLVKLTKVDADIISNHFETVKENGDKIRLFRFHFSDNVTIPLSDCDTYLLTIITMHGLAYRRELLINNAYSQTEGISYTDQEWSFKPFGMAKTLYDSDEVLYKYLLGREGQTMEPAKMAASVKNLEKVANELVSYYSDNKWDNWLDVVYMKKMMMLINSIYSIQLTCSDDLHPKSLEEFDKHLLSLNEKVYDSMNYQPLHEKVLRVHYIRMWRRGQWLRLRLSLSLFKAFQKIQNIAS